MAADPIVLKKAKKRALKAKKELFTVEVVQPNRNYLTEVVSLFS